ncbi:MAG: phosphohistidine phosphatase SixA [Thermostichales cyanobacterium BF4_bins_65]
MKWLYLIRHGIAEDPRPGQEDGARALTAKGVEKTGEIAKRLGQWGWRWDVILTSPLLRAQQTAEILWRAGLAPQVEVFADLAPGGSLEELWRWWQGYGEYEQVAVVGHQPDLALWLAQILGGQPQSYLLKKAGVAWVELASLRAGQGILLAFLPPKLILGESKA